MKSVNVIIKDELKKELKDFAKQVCVGAASYVRDELTNRAYEVFERFYCDYAPAPYGLGTDYDWKFARPAGTPKYYDRTYNVLRNGIEKFYEDKHGKIIRGGVEINPEWLEDNYDISPQFVFESIYEHGWHGPMGSGIPSMSPTPKQLLDRSYLSVYNNVDVAVGLGVNRAKKGSYSFLRW